MKKPCLFLLSLLLMGLWLFPVKQTAATPLTASYNAGTDTINVIPGIAEVFNLTDIDNALGLPARLNEVASGIWELNASMDILTGWGALFEIINEELRIISYPSLQRVIRFVGNNLTVQNSAIYGWESGTYDTNPGNGRSKIRTHTNGYEIKLINSTLAYLGNGTKTTSNLYTAIEANASLLLRTYLIYEVLIDNCTIHNCSSIYLYGDGTKRVYNTTFQDFNTNITLYLKFCTTWFVRDNIFNNATTTAFADCYWPTITISAYVSGNKFLNQYNDRSWVIIFERSRGCVLEDNLISNCKNNSLMLSWNTSRLFFYNLTMNNTGTEKFRGVLTQLNVEHIAFRHCTFIRVNTISLRKTSYLTFENCTVDGQFLGEWQIGLEGGINSHIYDCHVYNCSWVGIQAYANSIIENNTVSGTDNGILLHGGNIWSWISTDNITVRNNVVYNTTYNEDWWGVGIRISGTENGSINDVEVYNNTVTGGNMGVMIHGGANNVEVYENQISNMPFGTGGAYLPYGYTRDPGVSGYLDPSKRRIITGIGVIRQLGGSWNWTVAQTRFYDNIHIYNNTFDGSYLQAYVMVDKLANYDDQVFIEQNITDAYVFEFTDSFYGGKIIYANPDNPVYAYQQANYWGAAGNVTWEMSLNYTSFGWEVPENSSSDLTLSWVYPNTPYGTFTFTHVQPRDNLTRTFTLYPGNLTGLDERTCASWYRYENDTMLRLTYELTGDAGENSTNIIYGVMPQSVLFNGATNTALWDYSLGRTRIFYVYSSTVEIEIVWGLGYAPYLPVMFLFGMVGLASMFAGILWPIHIVKKDKDYVEALTKFVIFFFVGLGLFIAWVWMA